MSTQILSSYQAAHILLGQSLQQIWWAMPTTAKLSWLSHPDADAKGAYATWYYTSHRGWLDHQAPTMYYLDPTPPTVGSITSATCQASGSAAIFDIAFGNPEKNWILGIYRMNSNGATIYGHGIRWLGSIYRATTLHVVLPRQRPAGHTFYAAIMGKNGGDMYISAFPKIWTH